MIFNLVSGAQDKLADNLDVLKNEREEEARRKEEELQQLEEVRGDWWSCLVIIWVPELQAKFFGTAVTKENFLEWRKKFNEEMKVHKRSSSSEQSARLTGVL